MDRGDIFGFDNTAGNSYCGDIPLLGLKSGEEKAERPKPLLDLDSLAQEKPKSSSKKNPELGSQILSGKSDDDLKLKSFGDETLSPTPGLTNVSNLTQEIIYTPALDAKTVTTPSPDFLLQNKSQSSQPGSLFYQSSDTSLMRPGTPRRLLLSCPPGTFGMFASSPSALGVTNFTKPDSPSAHAGSFFSASASPGFCDSVKATPKLSDDDIELLKLLESIAASSVSRESTPVDSALSAFDQIEELAKKISHYVAKLYKCIHAIEKSKDLAEFKSHELDFKNAREQLDLINTYLGSFFSCIDQMFFAMTGLYDSLIKFAIKNQKPIDLDLMNELYKSHSKKNLDLVKNSAKIDQILNAIELLKLVTVLPDGKNLLHCAALQNYSFKTVTRYYTRGSKKYAECIVAYKDLPIKEFYEKLFFGLNLDSSLRDGNNMTMFDYARLLQHSDFMQNVMRISGFDVLEQSSKFSLIKS